MSSARMTITLGGPGGGVGDGEGNAATGVAGAMGELPPHPVTSNARVGPSRVAVRTVFMNSRSYRERVAPVRPRARPEVIASSGLARSRRARSRASLTARAPPRTRTISYERGQVVLR